MKKKIDLGYLADRIWLITFILLLAFFVLSAGFFASRIKGSICALFLLFVGSMIVMVFLWIVRPYRALKSVLRKATLERTNREEAIWKLPGFCREERDYLRYLSSAFSRKELLELEIRESELLALQTQINPHFLYNTLDAIRSDALVEGHEMISEIAESLAAYFRYSISALNHTVSLDEELHHIQEYFKIQRYRFGSRLQFEITWAEDSLAHEKLYIPKMILQPLVENAIFHGIEPKEEPGTVTIRIERTEKNLYLCVADNGVGMTDAQTKELNQSIGRFFGSDPDGFRQGRRGIALHNVNHRIRLIYGEAYGIYATSAKEVGTKIWMTLPVRTSEEKL